MKITEEYLDEIEGRLEMAAEVTMPAHIAKELVRLAKLGLSLDISDWEGE